MTNDLRAMLVDAVEDAARRIREAIGQDTLHGLALCTDNEVGMVYPSACTTRWVEHHRGRHRFIGVCFVDWIQEAGDEFFEPVSACLENNSRGAIEGEQGSMVPDRFEQLVLALEDCRKSKLFADDIFLACGSDDPDDQMLDLSLSAVRRLNTRNLADEYSSFLAFAYGLQSPEPE